MYRILYRDARHEPHEWEALYETKHEALRQAAFDLDEGNVVEVQDEQGNKLAGKSELRKQTKECLEAGLQAFVDRDAVNRKL